MNEPKRIGRPPRQKPIDVSTDLTQSVSTQENMKMEITKQNQGLIGSKIMKKGDMVFRHDLFELVEAVGKKNAAPYSKSLKIEEIPHKHFFHTHDSRRGKKLTHTLEKQGHIHNVEVVYHPDGSVTATCSPPLRERIITDDNGDTLGSEWVPVKFRDKTRRQDIIDDHTHECVYLGSQEMSINGNKARNNQTAQEIATILKGEM